MAEVIIAILRRAILRDTGVLSLVAELRGSEQRRAIDS